MTAPRSKHAPPTLNGCDVLPPLAENRGASRPRDAVAQQRGLSPQQASDGRQRRRQAGNRFATLNAFADATLRDLDRAEIAVWLLLFRDTKPEGLARTSQADLARRAGVTTRTVERSIRKLARAGLLTLVHRGGLSRGPSTYRIHPAREHK